MFSWVLEEAWAPAGRRRGSSSWEYGNGREWGAVMLIGALFSCFLFIFSCFKFEYL